MPAYHKRDKLDKLKSYARFHIPEYWIVEPELGILEKYVLQNETYELHDLYQENDPVRSEHLPCVTFTMNELKERIPHIE